MSGKAWRKAIKPKEKTPSPERQILFAYTLTHTLRNQNNDRIRKITVKKKSDETKGY